MHLVGNLVSFLTVKIFWKSVNNWQSYHRPMQCNVFLFGPPCILHFAFRHSTLLFCVDVKFVILTKQSVLTSGCFSRLWHDHVDLNSRSLPGLRYHERLSVCEIDVWYWHTSTYFKLGHLHQLIYCHNGWWCAVCCVYKLIDTPAVLFQDILLLHFGYPTRVLNRLTIF